MAPRVSFTSRDMQERLQKVTLQLRDHASALPKRITIEISKVPDWQRRATRLSIAVVFFGILGHCVTFSPEHTILASNFRQSCNWAAITCIVVTAPLIGKVAQVAFDRLLGTAVGGFFGCVCFTFGFHVFGAFGGGIFISLMSGVTVWATTFLAFRHALDQLARFMQLTYVIVAFGAKPDKGAVLLALLRVGGIFAGGVLSVLLAVLVLPRSASVEALREMKKALKALHDLNQEVWALSGVKGGVPALNGTSRRNFRKQHRHGYSAIQMRMGDAAWPHSASAPGSVTAGRGPGGALRPLPNASELPTAGQPSGPGAVGGGFSTNVSSDHLDLLVQHDEERDLHEARIEKLFTDVYVSLARLDENLAACKGEIYVHHCWGHYFFLPGVHWFPVRGRWQVPVKDLQDLATCLRRVARMLWTLLLDFKEGFGVEMEAVLQRYYPKQLLSELASYQSRAILDLLRAFPSSTIIEVDNLLTLGQVTDCLMQISDARSRTAFFNVKRKRAPRRSGAGTGAHAGTSATGPPQAPGGPGDRVAGPGWPEAELARAEGWRGRSAVDPDVSRKAEATLEKVPLLSQHQQQFLKAQQQLQQQPAAQPEDSQTLPAAEAFLSGALGAEPAVPQDSGSATSAALPARSPFLSAASGTAAMRFRESISGALSSSRGSPGIPGPSGGSDSDSGIFVSRLLSGQADGQPVALHATPRRYLAEQQHLRRQQQLLLQQQQLDGSQDKSQGKAAAPLPPVQAQLPAVHAGVCDGAAPMLYAHGGQVVGEAKVVSASSRRRSDSVDIFDNARFEGFIDNRGVAASPRVSQLLLDGAKEQQLEAMRRSSLEQRPPRGPALAAVAERVAASEARSASPFSSLANLRNAEAAAESHGSSGLAPPTTSMLGATATPFTEKAAAAAAAAGSVQPTMSSAGSTLGASFPANTTAGAGALAGPGGGGGVLLLEGLAGSTALSSMLSTLLVEPVTFPPTEEGYLSQVRWYSFQFVMDEMVEELEEAFHACSAVLRKLPYPIGGN